MSQKCQVSLKCQAANCESNLGNLRTSVKFFNFPNDSERNKQWISVCEREADWFPTTRNQKLCQMHFNDDQFENRRIGGLRKLKWNAVPTIKASMFAKPEPLTIKLEAPTYGIKTEPLYQGYEERLMSSLEHDELAYEPKSTCQICDHAIDNYPNALCRVCEKKFEIDHELNIQKKKKRTVTNYQCEECAKAFSNVNTYQRHIKCHDEKKPYRCDLCQKRFYHSKNLAEHMEIHGMTDTLINIPLIPIATQSNTLSDEFTMDGTCIKIETEQQINSQYPDIPPIGLRSMREFNADPASAFTFQDSHDLAMVQIENFELFDQERDNETVDMDNGIFYEGSVSPTMSTIATDTDQYKSIIKIETETIQSQADYTAFNVNVDAERPIDNEMKEAMSEPVTHQVRTECYICKHCNKDFMYFGNYAKHLDQHSIGKLMCKFCHQMFGSTYQIRKHIRDFHSNQEMFDCSVCFTTLPKHYFASHMRTHRSDDKTLICKYCGCRFSEPTALFYHFKNMHSNSVQSIVKRGYEETQPNRSIDNGMGIEKYKYKCKYCGLRFDDVIKMYHHVKVHVKHTTAAKKMLIPRGSQ